MVKLKTKELQILAIIISIWSFILIGSGISLNKQNKTTTKKTYSLSIKKEKIAESQAKINEIKLKNITITVNNPISVNVEDYLENANQISNDILSKLTLDTSLVNINQVGTYQYTIKYNKKIYTANIIVKEKELPKVDFTLKNIEITLGDSISQNPRNYINETVSDEVNNALTLDLSQVTTNVAGTYQYSITYKNTTYTGYITIKAPGPTIIGPNTATNEKTDDTIKTNETDKANETK